MKTKFLMMGICATMLFACKDDKKTTDAGADGVEKTADTIAPVKEEPDTFAQDSIEAQAIKGYSVKLVSGKHKYGGKTEVEYQSLYQVVEEDRANAKKEMSTKEELASLIKDRKDFNRGGRITLYFERGTIGAANNDNISIIVHDKDDKEILREEQEADIPEYSNDYWWNTAVLSVDKAVKAPFYIYIVDKMQDGPLKYEVTPIMK